MSTQTETKPTQLIEVENDLLSQILEATKSANGQLSIADKDAISDRVSHSGMFGLTHAQVFTLGCLAEARGIPFISAMMRYHLIPDAQGILRPSMRADAMQAEFQQHGGSVRWIKSTDQECHVEFCHPRHQPDPVTVHVTFEEMQKKGVTQGKNGTKINWRQWPRQMLRARAISEGVRMVDPGIVVGIYTPEEVSDFAPERSNGRAPAAPPVASQATGNGHSVPAEPMTEDEALDRVAEPTPEPREPGADDERPRRDPKRKAREQDGPWLKRAAERQNLTPEVEAYGLRRGFPDTDHWSPGMVAEYLRARKEGAL